MVFGQDEDRRCSLSGQTRLHPHVGQRGPQAEAAQCPKERKIKGGMAGRARDGMPSQHAHVEREIKGHQERHQRKRHLLLRDGRRRARKVQSFRL